MNKNHVINQDLKIIKLLIGDFNHNIIFLMANQKRKLPDEFESPNKNNAPAVSSKKHTVQNGLKGFWTTHISLPSKFNLLNGN